MIYRNLLGILLVMLVAATSAQAQLISPLELTERLKNDSTLVLIDLQIAVGNNLQVHQSMFGEERQHVVEESDTGLDGRLTAAIDVQFQLNIGFGGLTIDAGCAAHRSLCFFEKDFREALYNKAILAFITGEEAWVGPSVDDG